MILLEDKQLARKFVLTNSIRIAILCGLLLISLFVGLFFKTPFPTVPILISLSIAVGFSLLEFFLVRKLHYRTAIYLQLGMDLMVVTLLVYFSGGISSPFYFLYILPIIVSALFLKRTETVYVATFAFILFGLLADLMFLDLLPMYPGLSLEKVSTATFIYNLVMSFIAFSAVAMISSFYFEKIRATDEKLRNVRENFEDLMQLNNTVLEKMHNGFVTCSGDGRVLSYNEIARRMLRLDRQSNVLNLLLTPEEQRGAGADSSEPSGKYLEKSIHGRVLGISVTRLSGMYALPEVYVFIFTDLTEKKRIEDELKQREHLALIGEMAAGLAHEIRNPLASISGSVQFLQREMHVAREHGNLMEIIVKESSRLSSSIENFLNFTRTPPLEIEKVVLSNLVDDVIELLQTTHPGIRFRRRCDPTLYVDADPRQMSQVIWNLLNNAVKAVGDSGDVEAAVFRQDHQVRLTVKDNGSGMSAEDRKKLFSPFFSRFSTGIGLGMALVKRILDVHGCEIRVESQKNMGTEVTVCFPHQL
ncbi:MAG: ATP-binding protein [Acidobacteriota bacterium]|nr:ATP-binding protein [Acidobacteriota bacterium]